MAPIFSRVGFNKGFGRSGNKFVPFSATGGTKYTSGIYTIHKFLVTDTAYYGMPGTTTPYTFSWVGTDASKLLNADILIIAGGGSGGAGGHYGGGGGAGGYTYIPGYNILNLGNNIAISVGKGGRGNSLGGPENGDNSSFGPIISYGGGRGGSSGPGSTGGSSGGWGTYFQPGATNYGGLGAGPGGNHPLSIAFGGGGARNEGISNRGGGGGGAGGAGNYGDNYPGVSPQDGSGGPGLPNSIDGTNVIYAIGGPSGGGGAGPPGPPGYGYEAHRGHGGAGYGSPPGGTPFANAGSPGIVIVRYVS